MENDIIRFAIKKNYETEFPEFLDYEIQNEKIFVFNKNLKTFYEKLKQKNLKLEKLGIYFGKIKKNEKIQLSLEGSQIIGSSAKKNLIEIDKYETLIKFLTGEINLNFDNLKNVEKHNFPLVKYKNYIVCSAASLENEIKSLLPKNPKKILLEKR